MTTVEMMNKILGCLDDVENMSGYVRSLEIKIDSHPLDALSIKTD